MDVPSAAEYKTALNSLKDQGLVNKDSRYPFMRLQPPPKETVLASESGKPLECAAVAMVKQGPDVYEAVVNLTRRTVTHWDAIADF